MRIRGRERTVQAKLCLCSGVFRACACDLILGVAPCGNAVPLSVDTRAAAGVFRVFAAIAAIRLRQACMTQAGCRNGDSCNDGLNETSTNKARFWNVYAFMK